MFNSQSNPSDDYLCSYENGDLLAFWAPFLLVHLGGPDTITAFSVEDNQLWLRHLLAFITQAVATGYVFIKTLPRNRVMIPTTLLFIAGIIKFLERTSSLYFASKDKFRDSMLRNPDPSVNYAKLSEVLSEKPNEIRKKKISKPEGETEVMDMRQEKRGLDDVKVVEEAYEFFKIFKRLIVDLILSFKERDESRNFFNSISAEDAFKVIAGELNLFYEVLYTRVVIVHSKWGMFFHFISFCSVVVSLTIFHFQVKKYAFDKFGVKLTYSLLFGAIGLDILSFFMAIFSNWIVVTVLEEFTRPRERSPHWALNLFRISPQWALSLFGNFISLKKSKKVDLEPDKHTTLTAASFSHVDRLIDLVGLKDFLDEITYVSSEPLTMELCEYIFGELQKRSRLIDDAETVRKICSARGDWVLQNNGLDKQRSDELISYVLAVPYDEHPDVHIATELLINDKKERK
ncbi:hypothetical protein GH714_002543 [Hevea brasiliensis]|uniref:DUF4220 domain-containing protein n=1 Tax=Hevea brasiliensis TaxID=3981 RepID=A0A6A6KY92_HEVBR|nr:hypothetical protein GH714_002543 [Hevea brasiliensis]